MELHARDGKGVMDHRHDQAFPVAGVRMQTGWHGLLLDDPTVVVAYFHRRWQVMPHVHPRGEVLWDMLPRDQGLPAVQRRGQIQKLPAQLPLDGLHAQTNPQHRHMTRHGLCQHLEQLGVLFWQPRARGKHQGICPVPEALFPATLLHHMHLGTQTLKVMDQVPRKGVQAIEEGDAHALSLGAHKSTS